jgi:hypothetical protein
MRKSARSRRKLAIWAALPPYLGGKRRLCPLIFREIDRVLPRRLWAGRTFLDGFLGGGSVSLYAKAQGFRVVAADIAERAMIGRAMSNSRVKLCARTSYGSPSEPPAAWIETVPGLLTASPVHRPGARLGRETLTCEGGPPGSAFASGSSAALCTVRRDDPRMTTEVRVDHRGCAHYVEVQARPDGSGPSPSRSPAGSSRVVV